MLAAIALASQRGNGRSSPRVCLDEVSLAIQDPITIFGKFQPFGTVRFSVFIL